MSEKIMGALRRDFVDRMHEWIAGRESATCASSWPETGDPGIGSQAKFHLTKLPPMLGRVHDTEMAVSGLPVRYEQVVRQFWTYEGQSVRWHARHRQINKITFEVWVMKGHELLKSEFAVRHDNWRRSHDQAAHAA